MRAWAPLLPLLVLCLARPAAAQTPPPQPEHHAAAPVHHHPRHPMHHTPIVRAQKSPHAQPAPGQHKAVVPVTPAAPAAAPAPPAPEPLKGTVTGLPLPRFASLRSDEVNLRIGPDTRYPIQWVYKRRDLPVEILREFEAWRLVVDSDGVKGWVHQATLVGRRNFVITGEKEQVMRHDPRDDAAPVAILKPGVVGRIRSCDAGADWCRVQVGDYRGWLKRSDFWGTFPGEAVQ